MCLVFMSHIITPIEMGNMPVRSDNHDIDAVRPRPQQKITLKNLLEVRHQPHTLAGHVQRHACRLHVYGSCTGNSNTTSLLVIFLYTEEKVSSFVSTFTYEEEAEGRVQPLLN